MAEEPSRSGNTSGSAEALRDALYLLLHNAKHEIDGALASLNNSDDVGLLHHTGRMFAGLRLVHSRLKDLPQ